jgi:ABC-type transporter Mla subunit MlaD
MWNPLSLPLSLVGAAVALPRALADLSRGVLLLEQATREAAKLNETGEEARRLMAAGLERVDALNERSGAVLEELAEARATFAEAMVKVDRLSDQGDRVLDEIAGSRDLVARLMAGGDDLVAAGDRAAGQLRVTQAELEKANEQVARALEMAEPLDRMTTRAQKIAGTLRREN